MIGFIADVHINNFNRFGGKLDCGMNERCLQTLDTLEKAYKKASEIGVTTMVICGDLFDTTKPLPQVVAKVQQIIKRIPTIVDVGNHDRASATPSHHAASPLAPVAKVIEKAEIIETPEFVLYVIPFMAGKAEVWLPAMIEELGYIESRKPKILVFHLGVTDNNTSKFLINAPDSVSVGTLERCMGAFDISYAFAGNYHNLRTWQFGHRRIVQCGTLSPVGFSDLGNKDVGFLHTLGTHGYKAVQIEGPRFFKFSGIPLSKNISFDKRDKNYVEITTKKKDFKKALAWLDTAKIEGLITNGSIKLDKIEAKTKIASSASTIKADDRLENSVRTFIDAMQLEGSLDKDEITKRVMGYLK